MRCTVLVLLAACGDNIVDKTEMCTFGTQTSAATVQDRKVIGGVAGYRPDLSLAARDDELRTSIAARRQAAWQVVAKLLAPTPLGTTSYSLPAWHTWFARDDFERVFKRLYRDLGPDGRKARADLDVDAGFAWNPTALDGIPEWTPQRYADYVAQIDTQDKAHGIGGINRVGYSTGAMRQLIHSYARQYACRLAPSPDPYATEPTRASGRVAQAEQLALGACEWHVLGPFMTADGLTVTARGDGDADVYVRRGAPPEAHDYDCRSADATSAESCSVDGAGPIYVAAFGAAASHVDLDISYVAADVASPTCLDGDMPRDAVLVKADWHRKLDGESLPVFDTSAARMRDRLATTAEWLPDGSADPDASSMYTATLPNGNVFRLPALHVMTKELDHWLWITLWWSADPDADFGADRPASLPAPWRNYKMCVSSAYLEGDPDRRGSQPGTLGEAIEAVHGGVGAPSWCSNPYLERGEGNAATNCIGCHQHGGTELTPESILAQPHHGTTRVRNNFFTDYLWAIRGGGGEDLSAIIEAEIDYWDASDPQQ